MKYFFTKLRAQSRRIGAIVLVFGITAVVLAYFMGFYDISFLDRAEILASVGTPASTETETEKIPETETAAQTADTETEPADTAPAEDTETETAAGTGSTAVVKESRSVTDITDPSLLSDRIKSINTTAFLTGRGYAMTTADWDSSMRLGKMQFEYALPDAYSLNQRTVDRLEYVYPEDNTEYYTVTVPATEARPAIELYMGYILYDSGEQLLLIDKNGVVLFAFDDNVTIPAYQRDRNGLPLFYRWTWEDGEKVKTWFRISDDGKYFIASDYDPVLDSRGLTFDYPAWYGLSDNDSLVRVQEGEEMVDARLKEEADRLAELTEEEILAEEEQRKLDKTVVFNAYEEPRIAFYKYGTDMTGYIYRQAFNFKNGYAAVTGDENRQEMFFITETGRKALSGYKMYLKTDYERYVIESWRLPASYGIESIGSLYFDHGLVRVRKQIIDNWAYMTYDNIRVISDTEILVDRQGNEFPIPSGYALKGYSCGMLLLEKGGRYGFMDYTGNWIAEPVYAAATPFVNNLATLTTPDGRVGMIDTQGNIVLPFAYEAITQASSGLVAACHKDSGWQVFKIMAKP
ncbi:MAG: WG repeat-containing protein [Clostridia bacterium]|nr:WG repeat-containing protein [Clostridia bacterium]